MARMIWRAWAALCLLSGAVVAPLFLEVFAGGSWVRFTALPLRYLWLFRLGLPIVRLGWIPPRGAAAALTAFGILLSGMTSADLLWSLSVHPGWFLGLEWWQRPLYPWLDLLPHGSFLDRPAHLWILSAWNLAESLAVAALLRRASTQAARIPEGA